jgi:hypothetical protein
MQKIRLNNCERKKRWKWVIIQAYLFHTNVKFEIPINSESAITNLTISQYSTNAGPHGLKAIKGSSAEGAIEWLKKNA